jgi:U2-associated protein SR140
VADVICQSLRIEGTAVPRKLARLYLISDILHNSVSRFVPSSTHVLVLMHHAL